MEYIMGKKLLDMPVNMKIVKMLSAINESKGQQIIYKKQPKEVLEKLTEEALLNFTIDSCENVFLEQDDFRKIFSGELKPKTREEVSVVEFRDILKTVNNAYEDMRISSQTILELHGYLHRFSLVRGGKYRTEENDFLQTDFFREETFNNHGILIRKNIEDRLDKYIDDLCTEYNKLIMENEIDNLIIIASFILDFILISPFPENNIKMAKLLTVLLLNKNGYEVGKYVSLGKLYDEKTQIYFKGLFTRKNDKDKFYYNVNKWLEYFLKFVLEGYETLGEELNLNVIKKETKTKRIEKIVNSTLGYFTKDDIRLQCPDIPEPTINRVFNNLRKSGKIEVVAKGRSAKWRRV
ncbi:Fic family protein [Intestinibacter sp.]|uniref:Fic family protein n=1 Tax=Intestinibacter sp. TaxID=1965304 RepID=UPI002A74AC28|nr:cell filamentation protein Fic [Intestinibacter sp.]MDY2735179.1 cell filamentation protein Fic [Intestinibacter sp.]MDY4576155.1 cell filamentation protein Fic [Intestinibacter sp.]